MARISQITRDQVLEQHLAAFDAVFGFAAMEVAEAWEMGF